MIHLLEEGQCGLLQTVCRGTVFGTRILSGAQMYGRYPFADLWVQDDCAAIFRLDGALTVEVCGESDWDELREFCGMVSAQSLLCERGVMERLGFPFQEGGIVLGCSRQPGEARPTGEVPKLAAVHELLRACAGPSFPVPPWEPFYLDVSHRLRHGGLHLATRQENGILLGCAMTVAETPHAAVLGAVAVRPEYRGQGLGSALVRALLAQLPQPQITLLRAQTGHQTFYERLGFQEQAHWAQFHW